MNYICIYLNGGLMKNAYKKTSRVECSFNSSTSLLHKRRRDQQMVSTNKCGLSISKFDDLKSSLDKK